MVIFILQMGKLRHIKVPRPYCELVVELGGNPVLLAPSKKHCVLLLALKAVFGLLSKQKVLPF